MQSIALDRLKKMQQMKGMKSSKGYGSKYDAADEEEEMEGDTEEKTPASEEGAGKMMPHHGKGHMPPHGAHPELAIMIGMGKPMPHHKPLPHGFKGPKTPGEGDEIEDEESMMQGGKYGK
jgi:hypothetical protein